MKKTRKIFMVVILSVLIIGILSSCSKKSDGYYNNIKWGITMKDLKDKLRNDSTVSDDNKNNILQIVNDFDNINGAQAWIMYFFEDNKLSEITITITISENTTNITEDDLNKHLYDNFVETYGDPTDSNSDEYKWITKHSKISLFKISNIIEYKKVE